MAPLACLVMVLLFARSGLYRDREQRPGFATVISSLFQLTLLMLLYAVIEGYEFSSYYIFYAHAVLRAGSTWPRAGGCSSASAASCCTPRATAAGPCWWARRPTSRRS